MKSLIKGCVNNERVIKGPEGRRLNIVKKYLLCPPAHL